MSAPQNGRLGVPDFPAYPDSPDKIDAAYAAVMAWKARLDAVAKGVGEPRSRAGRRVIVLN